MDPQEITLKTYLNSLPEEKKEVISKLRRVILSHLPEGFAEVINEGALEYVVPLSKYPQGYHVEKGTPLPFLSVVVQKNHVALYHMGIYMDPQVDSWFREAYGKQVPTKLDMGKSCIRLKNPAHIPYDLLGELLEKISMEAYVKAYETHIHS